MARTSTAPKTTSPRKSRAKKRAEPKSKGLAPSECGDLQTDTIKDLVKTIESHGGVVLASYRDPLGGHPTALAALPIDKVAPTPFQRDLSEAHAKRLSDTIGKLGRFLDPIVAVPAGDQFWTPNGRHRLEAMTRLGARTITALVLPDAEIQYKILALNIEKAHNLREKSFEVIRMYRSMSSSGDDTPESAHALEFEEPAFATLGICYEHNGRFGGGAYHPILRRVDSWIEEPLTAALKTREARAEKIERLDARVSEIVQALKAKGFQSPYLKSFVVARVNPLRFMKTMPPFDNALDDILKRATKFNIERVKQEDIAASAAPIAED
jgi:ParB family chromosome partitioning protein